MHVPFCRARCDYCEFSSVPVAAVEAMPELDRYVEAVLAELELERASQRIGPLRTLFLGGGTPSLLGEERLERLLCALEPLLTPHAEVTVETNPEDVTAAYAAVGGAPRACASRSACRASSGVCAMRSGGAPPADPEAAYGRLRAAGVANVGIDLIFGIPGQGRGDLERELAQVARLQPDHVSWYELSAPPGTPLAARLCRRRSGAAGGGRAGRRCSASSCAAWAGWATAGTR